jgi:hypothetical protein
VNDNVVYSELPAYFNGVVTAAVVNQNNIVNNREIDFAVGYFQRFGSVVSRKNYHHFFIVDHAL